MGSSSTRSTMRAIVFAVIYRDFRKSDRLSWGLCARSRRTDAVDLTRRAEFHRLDPGFLLSKFHLPVIARCGVPPYVAKARGAPPETSMTASKKTISADA